MQYVLIMHDDYNIIPWNISQALSVNNSYYSTQYTKTQRDNYNKSCDKFICESRLYIIIGENKLLLSKLYC